MKNLTILNREFQHPDDGWYQIEAKGAHPNREAAIVQVIDDEACATIVNRFNADAAEGKLRHGHELLIDHEHFADDPDKETRAYGWLQKLQNREDGIYGQIRWTKTGKEAVDGGDYRFFSTEYYENDLVKLKNSSGSKLQRVRPRALAGLSLTNMNNNRGQKPITNRDQEFRHGSEAGAGSTDKNTAKNKSMKSIATKLGLSADASEESILAEVSKIVNRAETAEKELTPIKNRVTTLEGENKTLLDEQVDGLLAEHGVKDAKVINRLKPLLAPLKNREERVTCLADLGIKANAAAANNGTAQRKLHNREGKAPNTDGASEDNGAAMAEKIRNRATELQGKGNGLKWDDCWNQAQREVAVKN